MSFNKIFLMIFCLLLFLSCTKSDKYKAGINLMNAYFEYKEIYDQIDRAKNDLAVSKKVYNDTISQNYSYTINYPGQLKNYNDFIKGIRTKFTDTLNSSLADNEKSIVVEAANEELLNFIERYNDIQSRSIYFPETVLGNVDATPYSLLDFDNNKSRLDKISNIEDFAFWANGTAVEYIIENLTEMSDNKMDKLYEEIGKNK